MRDKIHLLIKVLPHRLVRHRAHLIPQPHLTICQFDHIFLQPTFFPHTGKNVTNPEHAESFKLC